MVLHLRIIYINYYSKLKKKTKRKNKKLCHSLLKYLDRLLIQINDLATKHKVPKATSTRFETIEKIKQQQWSIYFGKESKIPNRIVSLHKPYVRPIVRGKETKPVEFGAKVNKLQVDGISFIEHISFDALMHLMKALAIFLPSIRIDDILVNAPKWVLMLFMVPIETENTVQRIISLPVL